MSSLIRTKSTDDHDQMDYIEDRCITGDELLMTSLAATLPSVPTFDEWETLPQRESQEEEFKAAMKEPVYGSDGDDDENFEGEEDSEKQS